MGGMGGTLHTGMCLGDRSVLTDPDQDSARCVQLQTKDHVVRGQGGSPGL